MDERLGRVAPGETIVRLLLGAALLSGVSCGGGSGDSIEPPTTGSTKITTTTTGPSPDSDGYTLSIDGEEAQLIASTGSVQVDGLTAGEHSVGISGVAGNCTVEGENPHAITITPGETTRVDFSVSCVPPPVTTGTIAITTSTTGPRPDLDGYAVSVDGGSGQPIGTNATLTISDLAGGPHTVGLSGLAVNCRVEGANPQPVTVSAAETATVSFLVFCPAPTGSRIAFIGTDDDYRNDVYVMNPDGSGLTNLTNGRTEERRIAWSPDGSKILIEASDEIFLINGDGSGLVNLTNTTRHELWASWSPNGTKILFTIASEDLDGDVQGNLYTIQADGTGLSQLTNSDHDGVPIGDRGFSAWSPDGTQIAFWSDRDGIGSVYIMRADGTAQTRVAEGAVEPHWSPDGRKIAYIGDSGEIWVMNSDGTNHVQLTQQPALYKEDIRWSPDGQKIAYTNVAVFNDSDIWVMNADGTEPMDVSSLPFANTEPDWSPDGNQIVFSHGGRGVEAWGIYVVSADGGVATPITPLGSSPDWSP